MRTFLRCSFLLAAWILLSPGPSFAISRITVVLDGGQSVTVDNNSTWSNSWVTSLVIAADRSTTEGCPYDPPDYKGLFKSGDRIFVNNNYLAWFDLSTDDGISFANPPFGAHWERSGELAGWWTLNPSTSYFRYWKTGPDGCWNWAHNELIPGSASPRREQHWWDKYAPPTEHSLEVVSGASKFFTSYHYARQTTRSQWALVLDGSVDAAGVHYKTSARMTSWTYAVDIVDGNDSNGIANYIQAEVEYICKPNEIVSIWRFKPNNNDVVLSNAFVYLWTAYAQDEDGTACDAGGSGSQWPGMVYGRPLYNQSSLTLRTSFSPYGPYSAGTIVAMALGPTCPTPHKNQDIYTTPAFAVTDGSWIRTGEASNLSVSSPRFQYTNLGVPNLEPGSTRTPTSSPGRS